MASFTLHALEPALDRRLSEEARREGKSKNQLAKELLARSLGLPVAGGFADDYREFCGLWTEAEYQAFQESQRDNERIDEAEWT